MKKIKPQKKTTTKYALSNLEKQNIKVGNLFVALRDDEYTLIEKNKVMLLCDITISRYTDAFAVKMLFGDKVEMMHYRGVDDFYHFFRPLLEFLK